MAAASNEEVFRAALVQIVGLAARSDAHPDVEVGRIAREALESVADAGTNEPVNGPPAICKRCSGTIFTPSTLSGWRCKGCGYWNNPVYRTSAPDAGTAVNTCRVLEGAFHLDGPCQCSAPDVETPAPQADLDEMRKLHDAARAQLHTSRRKFNDLFTKYHQQRRENEALHGFLRDIAHTLGLGQVESYDDVCRAVERACVSAGADITNADMFRASHRLLDGEKYALKRMDELGDRPQAAALAIVELVVEGLGLAVVADGDAT